MFKIKAYQKYKLGQLYFPSVSQVTARKKLISEINARPLLHAALHPRGRNPKAKTFTAEEVTLIVAMLGYPPFHKNSEDPQNENVL